MTLSNAFKTGLMEETIRRLSVLPIDFRYLLTGLLDAGAPLPEVNSPLVLGADQVFWVGMDEYDCDDVLAILYDVDQDVFEIDASASGVFDSPGIRIVREGFAKVTDDDLSLLMEWFERRSFRYAVGSAAYISRDPWMTRTFPGYHAAWEATESTAPGRSVLPLT